MVNFNPENVTMLTNKSGQVPDHITDLIVENTIKNSTVMKLGKMEQMDGLKKKFQVFVNGGGAVWVNEGQRITTAKSEFKTIEMESKKLAIIMPVSKEYLKYQQADFFEFMAPQIADKFYKKFDEAIILGKNSPFKQSIAKSIATAGTNISKPLSYDTVLELEDTLYNNNIEPNAFISKPGNRSALRSATTKANGVVEKIYDRQANTIDGLPVADFNSIDKGSLITGDFNQLYYGIPGTLEYAISEHAQLSTLTNEDGTPVNLFEQDLVALRVTMHVAALIVKDDAFAGLNITPGADVSATMPGNGPDTTDADAKKATPKSLSK